MNNPNYSYYPPRRKQKKSKFVVFLLILGLLISSSLVIPGPAGTIYYLDGTVKAIVNDDGTHRVFQPNGVEFFNGQMVEGIAHGFGKYFDELGNLLYEGEWQNGIIYGFGIEYFSSGEVKYKGQWKNGIYHGEGTKFLDNQKPFYRGDWYYGVPFGEGTFYDENGVVKFVGQVINGFPHGQGRSFINGKLHYDGLWFEGSYFGEYGSFFLPDGTKLSPSLGRYYQELIESKGLEAAVEIVSKLIPHMDVIERSTQNEQLKFLLYQHLELPKTYNRHTITSIIREFESIPITIFEDLVKLGVRHRFIHGSIANQPEFSNIRETSRGISLANAIGISSPGHRLLITRLDRGNPPATAVHELGHGVDFFLLDNISMTEEFEAIRKQEAEIMFKNRFFDNSYFINYPEEYFAEFFAQFFLREEFRMLGGARTLTEIKNRAPKTFTLFEEKVVNYQSQFFPSEDKSPLNLAANLNISPSFTIVKSQKDKVELKLNLENIDHDLNNKAIFLLSSNSSLEDLQNTFNLTMPQTINLIHNNSNRLSELQLPFSHTSPYLIYLIVDEDGNYSVGEFDGFFPPKLYHNQNLPPELKIETNQPIIITLFGIIRNFFSL